MSELNNTTTPDAADVQAPPDDFNEYEAWCAKQEAAEEATEVEEPSEAPAEEPAAAESADEAEPSEDDEQDDDEADDEAEEKDEESDEKPRRRSGFQKRIDRLTREKRELEARLAVAEKAKEETPKEEAKPAEPKGKPKAEDFDSYDEFTEALTDWKLAEKDRAQAAARDRAQAEEAHKAVVGKWQERAAVVKKANPDYEKVLDSAADVPIPGYVEAALLESDLGPEIAYHLAKNRKELERIVALSPASAGREIGKIEARLESRPATPKPTVSKAPKPVKPVQGSRAGTAPSVYDDELAADFNAWEARRRADLKRK